MKLGSLLAKGVRWGTLATPGVRRVAGKAVDVATGLAAETRDAFGRGLRGEPEPAKSAKTRRPSPEELATWHANLEVEEGADLDEIHRAWKRLQRKYHPALHASDAARAARATELIQELNVAYEGLKAHLQP